MRSPGCFGNPYHFSSLATAQQKQCTRDPWSISLLRCCASNLEMRVIWARSEILHSSQSKKSFQVISTGYVIKKLGSVSPPDFFRWNPFSSPNNHKISIVPQVSAQISPQPNTSDSAAGWRSPAAAERLSPSWRPSRPRLRGRGGCWSLERGIKSVKSSLVIFLHHTTPSPGFLWFDDVWFGIQIHRLIFLSLSGILGLAEGSCDRVSLHPSL